MGAMIKADEACHRMKKKVSEKSELMRCILVHVVSAFVCGLVCCYSYWFPWFYCFINHFVLIYLPSVWSVVLGPKCMFIVVNVIVVVVVGEWRQSCTKTRNLHDDMYDEYVRRSRGPRRVLVYVKVERKQNDVVQKKVEMPKVIVAEEEEEEEEEEDEIGEEFHESRDENIVETCDNISEEMNDENGEENVEVEEEEEDYSSECESVDFKNTSADDHDENVKNVKETKPADGCCQNGYAKRAEETRSVDDELNKRVENFIARVNRRRWAEAEGGNWVTCSA